MKFELTIDEYEIIQSALANDCYNILDKIREAVAKAELDEDLIIDLGEALKDNKKVINKLFEIREMQREWE